ncbi:hypothetical protein HanOQP8_Chr03g0086731 [Helianthus annuus]|nr:hypothetical protein HanIR_Chr12g0612181 [Helianthus annuus]KAJ0772384.1 hypothetical protein HanOQP8_Chr03g0086731 [Helianthus annuus]KAJ0941812.1 hypothetical protein HanPSC8_Chr03g0084511 [Helianthus annuus]
MKFTLNEAAGLQNPTTLVVKIKGARMLVDKNLGEVRVPIKELLEGVDPEPEGDTMQIVSYQMIGRDGEVKGVVSFSYKFGEKTSGYSSGKGGYQPQAVHGAGGHSSSGNGCGTGFIGGLLISDVANSAGRGGVRRAKSFPTFSKRVFRSRVLAPLVC